MSHTTFRKPTMEIKNKIVAGKRILVANRGEIATRLFRAATELNMRTVGIYSHEDRYAVHRFKADEAYQLGSEGKPLEAYLDWEKIIAFAIEKKIDAIHPGYGFLSENPDFAKACEDNNIMFCGPPSEILGLFGDKIKAKAIAKAAGVSRIPGSENPISSLEEAKALAQKIGYPITLKAVSGGGGKGIREVRNAEDLQEAFERAQSEAKASFGRADVYIEKTIVRPKHIEVQILADYKGNCVHLYERDCSIQRRHQKVVEIAPAFGISRKTRDAILKDAIKVASTVSYVGVGTVEFLVDQDDNHYFLEVNPRIQVEHTVTEMITDIDIVQASIMLAAGRELSHPAIGIMSQQDIIPSGVAIQCRITTEDPQRNFSPDTGKIHAYRPAQGFGIRLDEGLGTSGGLVTPYYDSLLVKVTAHGRDLYGAARKMRRALKEFRIRGVKHNIPLLVNIVSHPSFIEGHFDTSFFEFHKEVFHFTQPRDRATKLMRYIGNVSINNPHNLPDKNSPGEITVPPPNGEKFVSRNPTNAMSIFKEQGIEGLIAWIKDNPRLLLTDTTMRDAHQSLFATRLRTFDILKASDFYREQANGLFSLEMWGGATFDTCLRFLKEDPWERLAQIREKVPNILLQMLLRGDNAVGYSNYPEWVIRDFIRLTCEAGLDVFRIFDCLNNPSQMATAIEEVKKHGKIAEASVCYTGNIADPTKTKYDLKYYLKIAHELKNMGADIICIKDMAGLLRPKAAEILVRTLKEELNTPIHLHTHATSGSSIATLLAAHNAGCDIIDGAVSSMSGLTSQPSLNALVASLEGDERSPDVSLETLDELGPYWESVRAMYKAFDPGINASSTRVYEHEIPGGQYSNLFDQARKVGVNATEFYELTDRYKEVNQILGDIIKVTPSSKVVGDFALLLQKNGLTGPEYMRNRPQLDYPDSVISFFKGHMGVPYGGFNEEVREFVLGQKIPPAKPTVSPDDTFENCKKELHDKLGHEPNVWDIISYRLYPKVFLDYIEHKRLYDKIDMLPTTAYFYGLKLNQEIAVDIESGKTLYIQILGYSEPDSKGRRKVFFQLNGFPREIEVLDESSKAAGSGRKKANLTDAKQIPAPMPGKVLDIKVKIGDSVTKGHTLIVTESMKMEYGISAKQAGLIRELFVNQGDVVEEGDLLCVLE